MFIVKSLLTKIQSEFKNTENGKWFVAILLLILLPVIKSRSSQLLKAMKPLLGLSITRRKFYTYMATPKMPWEQIWHSLWRMIPAPLTDGRLILAADDSMNPKSGKTIYGCDYHYNHATKVNQSKYIWSQNIVQVGLLKWIHGRYACIPLAWCFYQLEKSVKKRFSTKLEQVEQMVCAIYRVFKQPILLVADSWFAAKTLVKPLKQSLGGNFHFLSRLRTNTKLYSKKLPVYSGRGRPRKYGDCVGNAKELGKKRKRQAKLYRVFLYGKEREVKAYTAQFFLKNIGMTVNIVWVYYKKNTVVFFTTDLTLSTNKIIEYYGARWKIESGYKELKQDIGSSQTQARNQLSVTNHLNFCMIAVTLVWIYAARLKAAPKKRQSGTPRNSFCFSDARHMFAKAISQQDLLKVLFASRKSKKNNIISTILLLAV